MLIDLIKIDLSLGLLLLVPGYSILIALTKSKNPLGILGTLIVSMVLSLGITNFALILISKLGIKLTPFTIGTTILSVSAIALIYYYFSYNKNKNEVKTDETNWLLFFLIIAFSVFIRLSFLLPKIIPHTTDLGHHMYWVNYIIKFQQIPVYGAPDIIIGEHLIFGALSILTGIGIFSALPIAILFLINILSLLAIFLLTNEIATTFLEKKSANKVALLSLINIGIFYAVASPQATYINGGVIGNIMGNLLIPTIFYLFIKALKDKSQTLAGIGFFLVGILAYTHHLSAFIFIYSLLGFLFLFFTIYFSSNLIFKNKILQIKDFFQIFINIKTILVSGLILIFIFLIRTPSYLNLSAIDIAIGAPSKATRVGLTINNLIHSTGAWRVFYSIIGALFLALVLFLIYRKKSKLNEIYHLKNKPSIATIAGISIVLSWFGMIFAMSHWPALLKIDIISGRIANYLTYPSAVLAAFGVYAILQPVFKRKEFFLKFIIFMIVFTPGVISGLFDISESHSNTNTAFDKTVETFAGSQYLAEKTTGNQKILKDHLYLTGDTWVKNFLMRGYKEPLSRTYARKYTDPVKPRETCTRDMIAIPESEIGAKCFEETGVEFLILKNGFDTYQFETSNNFSKIYTSEEVVIFKRNN